MIQLRGIRQRSAGRSGSLASILLNIAKVGFIFIVGTSGAAATEELKQAAQEIAAEVTRCLQRIEREAGRPGIIGSAFRSSPVTDIVISPLDSERKWLDERSSEPIYDELVREINNTTTLNVPAVIRRDFLSDFEYEIRGRKVLDELEQKFANLQYKFVVFPKIESSFDGVVTLRFTIVHREAKCQNSTRPFRVRLDGALILPDQQQLPSELTSNLAREFLRDAGVVRRIVILPSVVGTAALDGRTSSPYEERLAYYLRDPPALAGPRPPTVPEVKRLWNQEYIDPSPDGDWLAQITFVMEPGPEMQIALWPRADGKPFRRSGRVPIARLSDYQPAAGGLELSIDPAQKVSRFDLPKFALQTSRDIHVYCMAYSVDGQATLLLPTLDNAGRPAPSRLDGRTRPYQFPDDFISGPMPAMQEKEPLHDGIIACWSAIKGLSNDIAKFWADNTAMARLKAKNARLPFIRGDVNYLVSELRKLDGVLESVLAFPTGNAAK